MPERHGCDGCAATLALDASLIIGLLAWRGVWFGAEIGDDGCIGRLLRTTALNMIIHANILLDAGLIGSVTFTALPRAAAHSTILTRQAVHLLRAAPGRAVPARDAHSIAEENTGDRGHAWAFR
ncbi:hypothetical protein [Metallibacterium sp.]|uniref:hypothetical protein n=1 Tax=Metallibacterium sp. TaxID=2940281 RepID=UPI0026239A5E|nr:hypothetical protein [Metallibacterium sp.]